MQPLTLKDRRLLVVGASSGIGKGFAIAAADLGAELACAARTRTQLEATAAETGGATIIVGDVADPADCTRIAAEAAASLGALDGMFYTPAPGLHLRLRDHDQEHWDTQFRPIVAGASNMTRALVPHLTARGLCAYLSSGITRWSPFTQYGMSGYAACKAALESMIKGWQAEEPAYRFTPVTIGSTVGVSRREQHQQDQELEKQIRQRLTGGGILRDGYMNAHDLGAFLAQLFAMLLAHPEIAVHELVLEPSAPPLGSTPRDH